MGSDAAHGSTGLDRQAVRSVPTGAPGTLSRGGAGPDGYPDRATGRAATRRVVAP